jgi:lipoyl(octanoyl) transferase
MPLPHASAQQLWVCDLGTMRYLDALALQERVRARRQAGELPDTLLLLEHPPVYTLGRRAGAAELPFAQDFYRAKGIEVHACDRGGRITYHGPGQLVGYPIIAVQDVHSYVRTLEAAIVAALARERIASRARTEDGPDYTGVWVQHRKIASIGVHVQRSVTTHGFAVNVTNDLQPFSWIVACGLPGVSMTSLEHELARAPIAQLDGAALMRRFRSLVVDSFCESFVRQPVHVDAAQLGIRTAHAAQASASEPSLNTALAV